MKKIIEIVPHKNEYGKLSEINITEFENDNEVKLPLDYKDFLKSCNGGEPIHNHVPSVSSDVYFYGFHDNTASIETSIFYALDIFSGRIPDWYIPIGYDSGGNLYIMSLYHENYGLIAFWNHENEAIGDGKQYFDNIEFVSNSFSDFLNSLSPK